MMESFQLIYRSMPLFLKGALMTLEIFLLASMLSVLAGVVMGTLMSQRFRIPILSKILDGLSFVARAVPFFVQLLIVYFVLPDLLNFTMEPFVASIIALGFCSSGYVAQFFRGALESLPIEQWESAYILGYSKGRTFISIAFPGAFRLAIPPLNNELESLLKSTAIVSSIGMLELTRMGMNVVSREMEPVPIYLALALLYLCMSLILKLFTRRLSYVMR